MLEGEPADADQLRALATRLDDRAEHRKREAQQYYRAECEEEALEASSTADDLRKQARCLREIAGAVEDLQRLRTDGSGGDGR